MEVAIEEYLSSTEREKMEVSSTQEKKQIREELKAKRAARAKGKFAARRIG
jgi:hypothetical protein